MEYAVFDVETDGLLDTVSKFHVGVTRFVGDVLSPFLPPFDNGPGLISTLVEFINGKPGRKVVGHNIIRYDFPALKILYPHLSDQIDLLEKNCIDTLPLAWHLWFERAENNQSFGLADIGEYFGVPKPPIEDWVNLSYEQYADRCKEDVRITSLLAGKLFKRLFELYPQEQDRERYISYLNYKMICIREQENEKWNFDKDRAIEALQKVSTEHYYKVKALENIMPEIPVYGTTGFPSKIFKANRNGLQSHATRYIEKFLTNTTLLNPETKTLKYVKSYAEPNAGSHSQVKNFLFSLGWVPDVYKTNEKGELIPQISNEDRELSDSVKALYEKKPALKNLEGIYMLSHRMGVLQGFLDNEKDGKIEPSIRGLTNTLRFKHRNIVNLPGVDKPYGKEIRSCLVRKSPNHLVFGCDMTSLEDTTKQHFMYFFDPEYVNTMRKPDFDPHLDLAVVAGFLTQEQADAHKNKTENHNEQRQRAKKANYSCVYGAGVEKLASSLKIDLDMARALHRGYWERNKAVKTISETAKKIHLRDGSFWVYNPISKFWIPLRSEKDTFSSLNQSAGVYIFDRFIYHIRKLGLKLCFQYHDEIAAHVAKWDKEKVEEMARTAIKKVNEEIKLNVEIRIDFKFGDNYADVH